MGSEMCIRDSYRAAAVAGDRGAAAARDGQRAAARRQAQGGRETGVVDVGDREPGDHEGRVLERALGQGQGVDRQVIDRGDGHVDGGCLLYTSPSPRDRTRSRMPSSAWKKHTRDNRAND